MIFKLSDSIIIDNVSYPIFFDRDRRPFIRIEGKVSLLKNYNITRVDNKYVGTKKSLKSVKTFKALITQAKETLVYTVVADSLISAKTKVALKYAKEKGVTIALAQSIIRNLGTNFKIEEL